MWSGRVKGRPASAMRNIGRRSDITGQCTIDVESITRGDETRCRKKLVTISFSPLPPPSRRRRNWRRAEWFTAAYFYANANLLARMIYDDDSRWCTEWNEKYNRDWRFEIKYVLVHQLTKVNFDSSFEWNCWVTCLIRYKKVNVYVTWCKS